MTDITGASIQAKVQAALPVTHIDLVNESHMHAGPATESHYKLVLVSEGFTGLTKVKRHQRVYGILKDELAGSVHALALHLYTPQEWQEASVPDSPLCAGKNN
jgi:BolA protein